MAPKVTSSGNRSNRKPSKPPVVTSSKGRGNRSNVSTARVSTGSNGKPKAGGARVTNSSQRTNTGSSRPTGGSRPALPPGNRGGAIVRQETKPENPRRTSARSRQAAASQGASGPNRVGQPAGSANRMYGANRVNAAVARAQQSAGMRRGLANGSVGTAIAGALLNTPAELRKAANLIKDPKGTIQRATNETLSGDQTQSVLNPRPKPRQGDYQTRFPNARAEAANRVSQIKAKVTSPAAAPAAPRSSSGASSGGGGAGRSSSPSRMPSSVTRSSAPKAPAAPAKAGQKFEDFNPNRGTSKTNNPLMKDFVGRMKDREDKAQASAASKLTSKFNTESNFSAEKVDGSKVDTKAKLNSTTSEYDKKKRRYGG
jgi:hypothetical protein